MEMTTDLPDLIARLRSNDSIVDAGVLRIEAAAAIELLLAEMGRLTTTLARVSLIQQDRQSSDTAKIDEAGRIARTALEGHYQWM
jgi:hypothetical protein